MFFEQALLPEGWRENVTVGVTDSGLIERVDVDRGGRPAGRSASEICLPGIPNVHSHAFQRAMAGLTERAGTANDSFWTWRDVMYGFVGRLGPADIEAIASQLYVEMLKAGFTSVAEFHYLHHQPDGTPYAAPTEMSDRTISAAGKAGIAITQLPVLYTFGGFGGQAPNGGQARFLNHADSFLEIVETLCTRYRDDTNVHIGMAPHSLRAVTEELLREAIAGFERIDASAPIHIHIAEQQKEVDDCLAWSGARPVSWLLERFDVSRKWCLVHATHLDMAEVAAMAKTGAVAGLCPTTEANLGDGIFKGPEYLAQGGAIGIGSDSNVSLDAREEMRLLEYGQRLFRQSRNVLAEGPGHSVGRNLFDRAVSGGAQALGYKTGKIAPGYRADLVVLDASHPTLIERSGDSILDAWIFTNAGNPLRDVYVAGKKVISEGHHAQEAHIAAEFAATLARAR